MANQPPAKPNAQAQPAAQQSIVPAFIPEVPFNPVVTLTIAHAFDPSLTAANIIPLEIMPVRPNSWTGQDARPGPHVPWSGPPAGVHLVHAP
jgi:hypothetical protein